MAQNPNPQPRYPAWMTYVVIGIIMAIFWYIGFGPQTQQAEPRYEIPYSQFKGLLNQGQVSEVLIRGQQVEGHLKSAQSIGPQGQVAHLFKTRLPGFGDESLMPALEDRQVKVSVEPAADGTGVTLMLAMVPWLLLFVFF